MKTKDKDQKKEFRKDKNPDDKKRGLRDETLQSIAGIVFFVIAFFVVLSAFGKAGMVGSKMYEFFSFLFGIGYWLIPLTLVLLGVAFWRSLERRFPLLKTIGGLVFFVSLLGLIESFSTGSGGRVGNLLKAPLVALFDIYSTVVFLIALTIVSVLIIFDTHLKTEALLFWKKAIGSKPEEDVDKAVEKTVAKDTLEQNQKDLREENANKESLLSSVLAKKQTQKDDDNFIGKGSSMLHNKEYIPPPLSLLEEDRGKPGVGDIKINGSIIKRTLQNFGIVVEMDEITIGPTVTRYSLKPAEGVKLSKIVGLQDNLALALAASTIRIEAPIPGKSLVGIEVPNTSKTTVGLGSMVGSKDFLNSEKPLFTAIGKDVAGKATFYDIAKMPHLLIAGTTGSGKSVTVHSILTSLLYRNSPNMLKFIMVDAKRVELTLYNKIPHLLTPVITEAKKTIIALKWAAKEMDRRYDVLEKEAVRDIHSYHKNIVEPALKKAKDKKEEGTLPETMPYIVIVIDELADLMQAFPRELEASIVRLAQMSRAVGIHLILSTQRPSVNVITGLIKANIPTRIALKVGSQIDSRTIIDKAGAEKLVGQGDMLFATQDNPDPVRIQSPYISENEVKKVVKYLVDSYRDEIPTLDIAGVEVKEGVGPDNPIFDQAVLSGGDQDDDDLYEEAREIVIQAGKASTSYIQRKLRVGYARAARLVDILEARGVIGPADGSRPREVLGAHVPTDDETI